VAGHSRDRVEAAAKACFEHDRADTNWNATYDEMARADRDLYLTDARRAIAAADEFDRVAGVVRIDTRDAEFVVAVARKLGFSARSMAHDLRTVQRVFDAAAAVLAAGVGEQQGKGQTDHG